MFGRKNCAEPKVLMFFSSLMQLRPEDFYPLCLDQWSYLASGLEYGYFHYQLICHLFFRLFLPRLVEL